MAKRKRKSYRRRRRSTGLAGLVSKTPSKPKTPLMELVEAGVVGVVSVITAKGIGMVDRKINMSGNKLMAFGIPVAAAAVGALATLKTNGIIQSAAKGVALGGALKLAEKVFKQDNLLSGTDDQPLMLPGIGSFGQADLPELPHYSENPNADVSTTGSDPQYYMGQPSEVLSGDDEEMIAY